VTEERFWDQVTRSDGCWEWRGGRHTAGYGVLRWQGKTGYAHRISYEMTVGPIPEGLQIDHLCRNRLCVNPSHLEAVTRRVNILRGTGFSARHAAKTHCPQGHPYAGHNLTFDGGARRCRECRRAHYRRIYLRRKVAA
jgi:hypothetical protein